MIDANLTNFDTEVVHASSERPVLVAFWAPGVAPCATLDPILQKAERDMVGQFSLGFMYENGRGVPNVLVEMWQANAGGRYRHKKDGYLAPLDPNFGGCGRTLTGPDGGYEFLTVRPGAYPWPNHVNNGRPMHIHWSIFGSGVFDLTGISDDPALVGVDGFQPIRTRLGVAYQDDCLEIDFTWRRDYVATGDAKKGNTFQIHIALRNLGFR